MKQNFAKKEKPSSVKLESKKENLLLKRENLFLSFMKDFCYQNQGKFDGKTMMKEGGKAWRSLKGVKSGGQSIVVKQIPKSQNQNQFTKLHKIIRKLKKMILTMKLMVRRL